MVLQKYVFSANTEAWQYCRLQWFSALRGQR